MKSFIYEEIKSVLQQDFILENPKDRNFAHYASTIAFSLAKEFKKSPKLIAEDFAKKFENNEKFEVTSLNGYLNFKLKSSFLNQLITNALNLQENFAKNKTKSDEKILLEYISANPTGPLHIGHVRGAVFGDTLQRISNYLGVRMDTEYYINDAGNQIDLLGISISLRAKEIFGEKVEYPEKFYRGEYIDEIIPQIQTKFGKEIFYNESRNLELANFAKDIVLDIIKKDLQNVGIKIQNYVSEKSLYNEFDQTVKRLEKSGQMYEKDDKIWIASTKLGDEKDRVVIRDDKRPTYLAGDIVYHNNKFNRKYNKYINIWGADHHGYIARIKAAINFLGFDEKNLEILLMQMVNLLKNGEVYKMSKRAGNSILMNDVLNEIGKDALRFIFISKAATTPLEFDVDELKKEDSTNSIFYINYAYARINQIFVKANKTFDDVKNADISKLDNKYFDLAFEALRLNEILNEAFTNRALHKIPDYLKNLASNFHKFYNENKIIGTQNENEKLKVCAIVALCIKTAFSLMGLEIKSKMEKQD